MRAYAGITPSVVLDREAAAKLLGCSVSTVHRLARTGKKRRGLEVRRVVRVGRNKYRVVAIDVERFGRHAVRVGLEAVRRDLSCSYQDLSSLVRGESGRGAKRALEALVGATGALV